MMETPTLTVKDVLSIHRLWIAKLFVEDGHTEAEIVAILGKRHLVVTYTNHTPYDVLATNEFTDPHRSTAV